VINIGSKGENANHRKATLCSRSRLECRYCVSKSTQRPHKISSPEFFFQVPKKSYYVDATNNPCCRQGVFGGMYGQIQYRSGYKRSRIQCSRANEIPTKREKSTWELLRRTEFHCEQLCNRYCSNKHTLATGHQVMSLEGAFRNHRTDFLKIDPQCDAQSLERGQTRERLSAIHIGDQTANPHREVELDHAADRVAESRAGHETGCLGSQVHQQCMLCMWWTDGDASAGDGSEKESQGRHMGTRSPPLAGPHPTEHTHRQQTDVFQSNKSGWVSA